jgi:urease accessory protein UreF
LDFFQGYLEEAGRLEAVFVYAGYDASSQEQWQRLNERMSAMKPARETREASLRLGKRLAGLAAEAFAMPRSTPRAPLISPDVRPRGPSHRFARDEVVAAYLHQSLSGLVSACQRLLPLGQSGAATLLWQLKPVILETVAVARETQVDEVCLSQPLLDIGFQPPSRVAYPAIHQLMMHAQLRLAFSAAAGGTQLHCLQQDPPWKVVRAFPNPGRGKPGASQQCLRRRLRRRSLELAHQAGPGAAAQITTTGSTRVYRPRENAADALQVSEIHLGEGALLEYLPDSVIPFRDARFEQRTDVHLEPGATLLWWEIIAPGKSGQR